MTVFRSQRRRSKGSRRVACLRSSKVEAHGVSPQEQTAFCPGCLLFFYFAGGSNASLLVARARSESCLALWPSIGQPWIFWKSLIFDRTISLESSGTLDQSVQPRMVARESGTSYRFWSRTTNRPFTQGSRSSCLALSSPAAKVFRHEEYQNLIQSVCSCRKLR